MGSDNTRRNKNNPNQKQGGLKHTMEEMLERLRNGLEGISEGLRQREPKLVPIPIPNRGSRRR